MPNTPEIGHMSGIKLANHTPLKARPDTPDCRTNVNPRDEDNLEHRPNILYKYRAATDRTLDSIATQSIWLSLPTNLNDPLECRTGMVSPKEAKELVRRMEEAAVLGLLTKPQIYSLTFDETQRWSDSVRRKSHRAKYQAVREMAQRHGVRLSSPKDIVKNFKTRVSKVGILSLSEDSNNELMWAHYADEHRGLVLGFSSEPHTLLGGQNTIPVTYSDSPRGSVADGFNQRIAMRRTTSGGQVWKSEIPFESELFRAVISTKPTSWEYEKEWRYVEHNHGLRPWLSPLVSVTFGVRMAASECRRYQALVRNSMSDTVEFYTMRVSSENKLHRHRLE
ncbi:DUF2971 domain-containing protein [Mycobacteroides immunogenum]|uniref:DUF2971 domain-containing protein n=1 Tax=Mycobacteroides immunogenum TaxID=83262 RepID=UPI0013F4F194|nr:DUF2971 domain-containing protein [Mycobacteroides immunogenum]